MPKKIIVLAFRCPNDRFKSQYKKAVECKGFMAAQLLNSDKGTYLVYCSKCGKFYLAEPGDAIYRLTHVDKNDIKFIEQPYQLNEG